VGPKECGILEQPNYKVLSVTKYLRECIWKMSIYSEEIERTNSTTHIIIKIMKIVLKRMWFSVL
jgi:hypothetical protein